MRLWRRKPKPLSLLTYTQHACWGGAYAARMMGEAPEIPTSTKHVCQFFEKEFLRIAQGHVGERDIVG